MTRNGDGSYEFGEHSFKNLDLLRCHFEQDQPVIGGDGGMLIAHRLSMQISKSPFEDHWLFIGVPKNHRKYVHICMHVHT